MTQAQSGRPDRNAADEVRAAAEAGDAAAQLDLENAGEPADARRAERVEALRRCAVDGGYPPEATDPD